MLNKTLLLKILLGTYIALCLIIAGLNYGLAPGADEKTAELIADIWHFYENEFKTALIILSSVLSIMIIRKRERSKMRVQNYIGFTISALAVHIIGPAVTGTKELYFLSMPLPWSSFSIQLFNTGTVFSQNFTAHWGIAGIGLLLVFVVAYNLIIFTGTILFGRRLQCSHVCLFNGFVSEIFAEAFPLTGRKKRKAGRRLSTFFSILRIILLSSAAFFTISAALAAAGVIKPQNTTLLYSIETYKYLSVELLMAMFFWVVFTGRGYCYYCPAGTVLALIGRASGQCIRTDLGNCISCGKCNQACPMSIDIKSQASKSLKVESLNCVGCGHCVDVCPTGTLEYTTRFLDVIRRKKLRSS